MGSPDLDETYVNQLVKEKLAIVGIKIWGTNKLFLFDGDFLNPGRPRLCRDTGWISAYYSRRALELGSYHRDRFMDIYRRTYLPETEDARTVILLHRNIDNVILAAQEEAARRCGLRLDEVSHTEGSIEKIGSFPFRFVVSQVFRKRPGTTASPDRLQRDGGAT